MYFTKEDKSVFLFYKSCFFCFSLRERRVEDCKDLIDAFQACIKTLSEGVIMHEEMHIDEK